MSAYQLDYAVPAPPKSVQIEQDFLSEFPEWSAPCVLLVDAEANIQTAGNDSVAAAGAKVYAPRMISGRIAADSVCLLKDGSAMVMIQQQRMRQPTGEDIVKQTLTIVSTQYVVGVEFTDTALLALKALGLEAPALRSGTNSGVLPRPRQVS